MEKKETKTKKVAKKAEVKAKPVPAITSYTIDAKNRALGRVASEAAIILRGKNQPSFERNIAPKVKVSIINASKIRISQKKMKTEVYRHYSGYPGGLKEETMQSLATRRGYAALFEKAIEGMLPANRLRKIMMKNLSITE